MARYINELFVLLSLRTTLRAHEVRSLLRGSGRRLLLVWYLGADRVETDRVITSEPGGTPIGGDYAVCYCKVRIHRPVRIHQCTDEILTYLLQYGSDKRNSGNVLFFSLFVEFYIQ